MNAGVIFKSDYGIHYKAAGSDFKRFLGGVGPQIHK